MSNNPEWDEFQDVVNGTNGVFAESALKAHDAVKAAPRPEGVVLEFVCQGCNRGHQVTLEWPEVIALKYGIDPAFAFRGAPNIVQTPMSFVPEKSEGAWRPQAQCAQCSWYYGIRIFFDEPERWLVTARRAGYLNPPRFPAQFEANLSAQLAKLAQSVQMGQMARR